VAGYLLFFGTSRAAFLVFIAAALAFVAVVGLREMVLATSRRRERLEQYATLGRFSAQMAHDVKNPLTAIKGAVQYLQADGDQSEVVSLLAEQVRRVETIVDRYQRMSSVTPKTVPFDLRDMLEAQARTAELTRPDVRFDVDAAERLSLCVGDEELLEQVFDNVLRNALEAMPEAGTVSISAAPAWNGCVVRIRDTGTGMDQRDVERAFDDFHTTKADGTGLGLAFARRVVEAHGGRIELNSVPDEGTEVTIHLPNS
jgi:signal transduction histidine kinase